MPLVESFSGIRGIYDDGLDEKVAARYAYSYFSLLKNKYKNKNLKIVIGTDTRQSRDILKNVVNVSHKLGIGNLVARLVPLAVMKG